MYELNLLKKALAVSEIQRKSNRVFRVLMFFVHIAIIAVLILTWLKLEDTERYSQMISVVRSDIASTREAARIREIESVWEGRFFQLATIREIISNQTNFGLILRELGLYLPGDDRIATLNLHQNNNLVVEVRARTVPPYADIFQYQEALRDAFERSRFIGRDIATIARTSVVVRGDNVDTIQVQMRADTRATQ